MTTKPVGWVLDWPGDEEAEGITFYGVLHNGRLEWVDWLDEAQVFTDAERHGQFESLENPGTWREVYVHGDSGDLLTTEPCDPATCQDCREAAPLYQLSDMRAASVEERLTVFADETGRRGLLVFTGGSLTGYRPLRDRQGQVHLGYLRPDGTEEPDLCRTEFRWVDPASLTPVGLLP